jgi:hypothetical protein
MRAGKAWWCATGRTTFWVTAGNRMTRFWLAECPLHSNSGTKTDVQKWSLWAKSCREQLQQKFTIEG